jgi:hypothetical protein
VLETADKHAAKTGEVLSAKEALDIAEEAYARFAAKAAETKKLKTKFAPPAPPKVEAEPSLSAQHSSRVTQAEKPKPKFKTAADRMSALVDEHFG